MNHAGRCHRPPRKATNLFEGPRAAGGTPGKEEMRHGQRRGGLRGLRRSTRNSSRGGRRWANARTRFSQVVYRHDEAGRTHVWHKDGAGCTTKEGHRVIHHDTGTVTDHYGNTVHGSRGSKGS